MLKMNLPGKRKREKKKRTFMNVLQLDMWEMILTEEDVNRKTERGGNLMWQSEEDICKLIDKMHKGIIFSKPPKNSYSPGSRRVWAMQVAAVLRMWYWTNVRDSLPNHRPSSTSMVSPAPTTSFGGNIKMRANSQYITDTNRTADISISVLPLEERNNPIF